MQSTALGLAAALALADASVVVLALPPIVAELDASVRQAAAVLGVYALVLALAMAPAVAARRLAGARVTGAVGMGLMAAASAGCALAGTVGALLAFRAAQATGAAAGLVAAFALLDGGGRGRRLWTAAAVFGTAAGPALGGAVTQWLDWRAVFWIQVPIALGAAAAAWARGGRAGAAAAARPRTPAGPSAPAGPSPPAAARPSPPAAARPSPPAGARPSPPARAGPSPRTAAQATARFAALALVAASLVGVLFLAVLLLSTGWSLSPLGAAATVSVLPVAALAGALVRGDPRTRACVGAALLGGGVLALSAVPDAHAVWTVVPQAVAGAGMGLALPALAGELLPERTPAQAAGLLAARHVGIAAALALLAPVAAAELDRAVVATQERGAALILDARLPPLGKLGLVRTVSAPVDVRDPRGSLRAALARGGAQFRDDPQQRAAYRHLAARADDAVVEGVDSAFRPPLAICGGFGLLAALLLAPPPGGGRRAALVATAAALLLAGAAYLSRPALAPEPVRLADPCNPRPLPHTGGVGGAVQDAALRALDRAACRWGSSREELALALVDDDAAARYRREHGHDPRDALGLLGAALGL